MDELMFIDDQHVRETVAKQFHQMLGGDRISTRQRIPYVNKITNNLIEQFEVTGWPESLEELRDKHVIPRVKQYG